MFDTKKITEEQRQKIIEWADDGAQLADIQKFMEQQMEMKLTYMDTRFLVLDLGITLRDLVEESRIEAEKNCPSEDKNGEEPPSHEFSNITEDDIEILPPIQNEVKISVTIDQIAKPGLMASGRVTFSDNKGAMWYIDDRGLGLNPDEDGYEPRRSDIEEFQMELQKLMDRH